MDKQVCYFGYQFVDNKYVEHRYYEIFTKKLASARNAVKM